MKTITYQEVLNRAVEAAGRTRDKLPTAEALILKSVFAMELRRLWQLMDWPELVPAIYPAAVTAAAFSKNENPSGGETELGDILGVYSANPRTTTIYYEFDFDEGDDTVRLHPNEGEAVPATVYVEYMLPCPDLLDAAILEEDTELEDYELPRFLGQMLALRGAAHLLTAEGNNGLAGVQFGLAEQALQAEVERITRPPWRERLRLRR